MNRIYLFTFSLWPLKKVIDLPFLLEVDTPHALILVLIVEVHSNEFLKVYSFWLKIKIFPFLLLLVICLFTL